MGGVRGEGKRGGESAESFAGLKIDAKGRTARRLSSLHREVLVGALRRPKAPESPHGTAERGEKRGEIGRFSRATVGLLGGLARLLSR